MKLSTLYTSYQDLLIDLNLYGKIISTSSVSREDIEGAMLSELQRSSPPPTLEDKRYKLSRKAEHTLLHVVATESDVPFVSAEGTSDYYVGNDVFKGVAPQNFNTDAYCHPMTEKEVDDLKNKLVSGVEPESNLNEETEEIQEYDNKGVESSFSTYAYSISDIEKSVSDFDIYEYSISDIEQSGDLGTPDTGNTVSSDFNVYEYNLSDIESSNSNAELEYSIYEYSISNIDNSSANKELEYTLYEYNISDIDSGSEDAEYEVYEYNISDIEPPVKATDVEYDTYEYSISNIGGSKNESSVDYETYEFSISEYEAKGVCSEVTTNKSQDFETYEFPLSTVASSITEKISPDIPVEVKKPVQDVEAICEDVIPVVTVDSNIGIDNSSVETNKESEIKPEISTSKPTQAKVVEDEPKDLVQFLKKHPRSELKFVLEYFDKKEVEKALKLGKVLKRKNKLFV